VDLANSLKGKIGSTRVGVLTVTTEEFDIARGAFSAANDIPGTGYFVEQLKNPHSYDVVLKRINQQTNIVSYEVAGGLLEDFLPGLVILLGTAGGNSAQDLELGDVVVAEYISYAGYWKYKEGMTLERKLPHDHPSNYLMQNFIEPLRVRTDRWRPKIKQPRPAEGNQAEPKMVIGEVVSGNSLYGDSTNAEQRRIMSYFDKACAFEMEGFGVGRAVHSFRNSVYYNPQFLVIRGVSDFVDKDAAQNQATRVGWTPYAVHAAAAVATTLVKQYLQTPMEEPQPVNQEGQNGD
jgi:nucleoside phosphorylase